MLPEDGLAQHIVRQSKVPVTTKTSHTVEPWLLPGKRHSPATERLAEGHSLKLPGLPRYASVDDMLRGFPLASHTAV